MKEANESKNQNGLTHSPKVLINLYALLAILIVLIPEWIAEIAITIDNKRSKKSLPKSNSIWETHPELKISTMNIKELRKMASMLNIKGYSRDNRKSLTKRLVQKLNKNSKFIKLKRDSII